MSFWQRHWLTIAWLSGIGVSYGVVRLTVG
jgi:hypothetical protein